MAQWFYDSTLEETKTMKGIVINIGPDIMAIVFRAINVLVS